MTPAQIALVQESFRKVIPIREQAAALFYVRLFEIAPEVRPMFQGDMTKQGAKLVAALGTVVRGLDRLDMLLPEVEALARRHVAYGVRRNHYGIVGEALLWTLERAFGPAFTLDHHRAWAAAYTFLSGAMIAAAERGLQPA